MSDPGDRKRQIVGKRPTGESDRTRVESRPGKPAPDPVNTLPDANDPDIASSPTYVPAAGERTVSVRQADELVGMTLGEYEVGELMSRGGMGAVYRGMHPLIGKPVAIKILLPHIASDAIQVQRLLQEAKAVNAIRHPNIVDIFSVGQLSDGRNYLVMELLDGQSLEALLGEEQRLSVTQAATVLDQCFAALDAAHAAGVIHRDLKPGNIFITTLPDGTWRVKLLDFGIAKVAGVQGGTAPDIAMGTVGYMSPEQIHAEPVERRTDLYAMGVVAFCMIAGRQPFVAESAQQVLEMHLDLPAPRLTAFVKEVPAGVDNLIASLLEKEPDLRPESAATARKLLAQAMRDSARKARPVRKSAPALAPVPQPDTPSDVPEDTVTAPKGKASPRLPLWLIALISVVAAVALIAALIKVFKDEAPDRFEEKPVMIEGR